MQTHELSHQTTEDYAQLATAIKAPILLTNHKITRRRTITILFEPNETLARVFDSAAEAIQECGMLGSERILIANDATDGPVALMEVVPVAQHILTFDQEDMLGYAPHVETTWRNEKWQK